MVDSLLGHVNFIFVNSCIIFAANGLNLSDMRTIIEINEQMETVGISAMK